VKLKVVPPVHVSAGSSVIAAAGNTQVLVRNSGIIKDPDTSVDCGLVEPTSVAVVDGNQTEKSSTHVEDDSYDEWSEVKSVKSPRRKKTNSADSVENRQVGMQELCCLKQHFLSAHNYQFVQNYVLISQFSTNFAQAV